MQGGVQQLYSIQCPSNSSLSVTEMASIQCLNLPGGPNCHLNPRVSLIDALAQAEVRKLGGREGETGRGREDRSVREREREKIMWITVHV